MTPKSVRFERPQFAQRVRPEATFRVGVWVQLLHSISFLVLQLTAGLVNAWELPATYVLAFEGALLLALISTPTGQRQGSVSIYFPVVAAATAVFILTIFATAYALLIALQTTGFQALNAFLYFLNVVFVISILVWDSRRRFGKFAASNIIQCFYVACITNCILQLVLLYGGFSNPIGESLPQINGEAVFAKYLGFENSRAVLPIASSLQAGAAVPLATCMIALAKLGKNQKGYLNILVFLVGLYMVVILDAQQFILSIGLTGVMVTFVRSERIYGILAALAPWMYVTYASVGQRLFPSLVEFASSRGRSIYGLFTGREYIWNRFWDYSQDADFLQLVFGNGSFGQGVSRLSSSYAVMFAGFPPQARYLATLHNSYLQIIVDNGLIGLASFTALIGFAAYRARVLSRQNGPSARAWSAISMLVVAFAFAGASEVAFTIYMKEALVVTVLVSITVAVCAGGVDLRTAGRGSPRTVPAGRRSFKAHIPTRRSTPQRVITHPLL